MPEAPSRIGDKPLDGAVVGVRVGLDSGTAAASVGLACVDAVCLMDVESKVAALRVLETLDVLGMLLLVIGVEEVLAAGVLVSVTTEEAGHVRNTGCSTQSGVQEGTPITGSHDMIPFWQRGSTHGCLNSPAGVCAFEVVVSGT